MRSSSRKPNLARNLTLLLANGTRVRDDLPFLLAHGHHDELFLPALLKIGNQTSGFGVVRIHIIITGGEGIGKLLEAIAVLMTKVEKLLMQSEDMLGSRRHLHQLLPYGNTCLRHEQLAFSTGEVGESYGTFYFRRLVHD